MSEVASASEPTPRFGGIFMRTIRYTAAVIAIAALVTSPMAASATTDGESEFGEPVVITVLGLEDGEVGDTVEAESLIEEAALVDQDLTDELTATSDAGEVESPPEPVEVLPVLASSSPNGRAHAVVRPASLIVKAAADSSYRLVRTWFDNKYIPAAIRQGTSSWGWSHIQKHNVSLTMIEKTTRFPRSRTVGGTTITYVTPANEFTCWIGICRVTRTMDVRVVSNNTRLSDGSPKGVITSYCVGTSVCPAWVRKVAG